MVEDEALDTTQESDEAKQVSLFGVRHVMLWTLGSGLYLGATNWVMPEHLRNEETATLMSRIVLALVCLPYGAIFSGMVTLVTSSSKHHRPLLSAPGHWMVLNLMGICTYDLVARLVITSQYGTVLSWQQYRTILLVSAIGRLLLTLSCLSAAVVHRGGWRTIFVSLAMIEFAYFVMMGVGQWGWGMAFFLNLFTIIVAFCSVGLTVKDNERGTRDWVHYCGVTSTLAFALLATLSYVSALF